MRLIFFSITVQGYDESSISRVYLGLKDILRVCKNLNRALLNKFTFVVIKVL